MYKIIDMDKLALLVHEEQSKGKRFVMPIGTFNPARRHHYELFREAAESGIVTVAMNSDPSLSVYRNGNGRNDRIFPFDYRAELVSRSPHVTHITAFDDPKAVRAIETILPDEIWKGPDYALGTIDQDERRKAEELGIKICFGSGCPKDPVNLKTWLEDYMNWLYPTGAF
ncbi:MAG: hypothetical protein HY514_03370 [Candidatus Aenigmarchaeota archaeon]|nr:hypothetical protein [Candidatus Aenigmarchaeota archaeon]